MLKDLKDLWNLIKKYILEGFGVFLGFWAMFNIEHWTKVNQLLLTIYLVILIRYKLKEKKQQKIKQGKTSTLFKMVVKKTETVKILNVGDNADIYVESLFNFSEKIRKEGKDDMKKIGNIFKRLFSAGWANKFTMLGDVSILSVYYVLMEDLFKSYGWRLANQPKAFYIHLIVYSVGLILALIAANGKGLERVEQFLSRINLKTLNTVVDELIDLSIETNAELVNNKLNKAYELLEKVQPYIQEKKYHAFKISLDNVREKLDEHNALKILKEKEERERAEKLAQEILSKQKQVAPTDSNSNIRIRQ